MSNEPEKITGSARAGHLDYTGAKMGMWIFLFTELLFFGGLFLLYSVYRVRYLNDFHLSAGELDLPVGTVNTLVLLTSSMTMALSVAFLRRGRPRLSLVFQLATISLGMVFLANKYVEWSVHIGHGLYPDSPQLLEMPRGKIIFYSLYYVMTGLHGLHVVIGVGIIAVMAVFTRRGSIGSTDFVKLENTGLYWHFVDIVWIYLFPLFYLIT